MRLAHICMRLAPTRRRHASGSTCMACGAHAVGAGHMPSAASRLHLPANKKSLQPATEHLNFHLRVHSRHTCPVESGNWLHWFTNIRAPSSCHCLLKLDTPFTRQHWKRKAAHALRPLMQHPHTHSVLTCMFHICRTHAVDLTTITGTCKASQAVKRLRDPGNGDCIGNVQLHGASCGASAGCPARSAVHSDAMAIPAPAGRHNCEERLNSDLQVS